MFHSLYQKTQAAPPPAETAIFPFPASFLDAFEDINPLDWQLLLQDNQHATQISYETLKSMPQFHLEERLVSAEGWSVKAKWSGVLLREVIEQFKPEPQCKYLIQTNATGHHESLPLDLSELDNWLLCTAVNDIPLSPLYGGPVRLIGFNRFSYKGLSQITQIDFTEEDLETTYWQSKGYSRDGKITGGDYYAFDFEAFRPVHTPS